MRLSNGEWDGLKGASIVVTGGGAGIGRIYSEAIAGVGARVVVADIDEAAASSVAGAVSDAGGDAIAVAMDISNESSVEAGLDFAQREFGDIYGLVNNAALMSVLPRRSWLDIPLEEWDRVMAVNLRGLFLVCRGAVRRMGKGGSIVNISSNRIYEGTPNRLHYTTSKAGVLGFTRALAREVGAQEIRVNGIAPGLTLSDTQLASSEPEYLEALAKGRALARHQQPNDLVGAVLFLLSKTSGYITGQTIVVDGGKVMQ